MAKRARVQGGDITVQLTGDWDKLENTINHLNANFHRQALLLQEHQAERLKRAIEDKVLTMTGKPYDARRPVNTGTWWLETLELWEQFELKQVQHSGGSAYVLSFGDGQHSPPPNAKKPATLSYAEIAEKNEKNHPLFKPVWEELEPEFIKEWNDLLTKAIRGGI